MIIFELYFEYILFVVLVNSWMHWYYVWGCLLQTN